MSGYKITLFLSIAFVLTNKIMCQEMPSLTMEKFFIYKGKAGELDFSSELITNEAFLHFYSVGINKDSIFMANVWPKSNSQSYGLAYEFNHMNDYYKGSKVDIIQFNWYYHNTYDGLSGYAEVSLLKIYHEKFIEFYCVIEPENKAELIYSGFVGLKQI